VKMSGALLPVMRSLNFASSQTNGLREIDDVEWSRLLALTDRSQLTLPLGVRCLPYLPEQVAARIKDNLANNAIRQARIAETYQTVAAALGSRGIDFLVLKGFSHCPFYCDELRHRPQYDLDLYCPPESIERAYRAIGALGYEPFGRVGQTAMDHLPPLILKTGWRPRDDYYDPEMPITIELHFRFWDAATERFDVPGADGFWDRRQIRTVGSMNVPTLHPVDAFSYASWHLVRHLLRGEARAYHVYELAHFLHRTAEHDTFWRDCREMRPSPLLEIISCRLAQEWFGCRMHPLMQRLVQALPSNIERWFDLFGYSPLLALERPNKDELFLHFCLANGLRNHLHIARRRLMPRRLNPYIADPHVPSPDMRLRWKRRMAGAGFMAKRAFYHARTLLPVIRSGFRWRKVLAR
jgi:hypothetical protein